MDQFFFLLFLLEKLILLICVTPHFTPTRVCCVSRCGTAVVNLALKFNSPTKEGDVIAILNIAAADGILGDLSVLPSTETVVCPPTPTSISDGKFTSNLD